jgi:hypothetical protein
MTAWIKRKPIFLIEQERKRNVRDIKSKEYVDAVTFLSNWQFVKYQVLTAARINRQPSGTELRVVSLK